MNTIKSIGFILGLSLLFFIPKSLIAQSERSIQIGVKLIPELSTFSGSGKSAILTIGSGFQLVTNFNKNIGIESGIYHLTKGYGQKLSLFDDTGNFMTDLNEKIRYSYLSLPLLIRIRNKSLYASAGPTMDLLYRANSNVQSSNADHDRLAEEGAQNLNLGFLLHLGCQKEVANNFFLFCEARFNPSLSKTRTGTKGGRALNAGLAIGANYSF